MIALRMLPKKIKSGFIEPMLLLRKEKLPLGDEWLYELKLDGYRAIAIKTGGKLHLRSRKDHDFSQRYCDILSGLSSLPSDTVIDGEIVALDEAGKPCAIPQNRICTPPYVVGYIIVQTVSTHLSGCLVGSGPLRKLAKFFGRDSHAKRNAIFRIDSTPQ